MLDLDKFEDDIKTLVEELQFAGEAVNSTAVAAFARRRVEKALRKERHDAAVAEDKIQMQLLKKRAEDLDARARLLDRLEEHESDSFIRKERLFLAYEFFGKGVAESDGDMAAKNLEEIIRLSAILPKT